MEPGISHRILFATTSVVRAQPSPVPPLFRRGRGPCPWLRPSDLAVPPTPPRVALRVHASERILAVEDPPKRRDPPLGLRAGPARHRASLARAVCPGVSGSVLHH